MRRGQVWTEQAKLVAGDAAAGDNFGHAVAISGDTAVVGPHLLMIAATNPVPFMCSCPNGDTWQQQAKLTAALLQNFPNPFNPEV